MASPPISSPNPNFKSISSTEKTSAAGRPRPCASVTAVFVFYVNVLERDWHIFSILRAQNEHRLPAVLSVEEVRSILAHVKTFHNHVYLSTVYACGLRLHEGLHLEVSDIDSQRMMIHVHRGKGAKDRYLPLPNPTLNLLRRYWRTHRHPQLLFPALGRKRTAIQQALTPMAKSSVQGAFRHAKRAAGVLKKGVSIHTLRSASP